MLHCRALKSLGYRHDHRLACWTCCHRSMAVNHFSKKPVILLQASHNPSLKTTVMAGFVWVDGSFCLEQSTANQLAASARSQPPIS
jgi:hypothetical protein